MNQIVTSLDKARFWVRPYEFEGDRSSGVAAAQASLEVGGKTRTFWLKTLENRLFFREVGRDENWNFGALDELSDAERSNLPLALANVLANESYGRVVLPRDARRPCLFLAAPDNGVLLLAPRSSVDARGVWTPQYSARARPFLDRSSGVYESLKTRRCRGQKTIDKVFLEMEHLPIRVIRRHWARGTPQEWERVVKAFFHLWWPHFHRALEVEEQLQWELQSAWAMQNSQFSQGALLWERYYALPVPAPLQRRANFICKQFLFAGQGKSKRTDYLGRDSVAPRALYGTVSQPTQHEILEAHLFLRDWINARLPPKKARRWLDFP